MTKIFTPRFIFVSTAIFLAAISRIFPHIPNFTPIAAMALFGGVHFKDKRFAFVIPLIAMIISDCILEITTGWGFHNTIMYVYASFILTGCIGLFVRKNPSVLSIGAASIVSSLLFFLITNFGVWAAGGAQLGASGLLSTYILGVPFFGPTLLGDLFFNALLFGSLYFAQKKYPALIKA